MKKKMFSILVAGMMIAVFPAQAMADEVDDRIAEIEAEIYSLQEELGYLKTQKAEDVEIEDNQSNITLYDNEVKIDLSGISSQNGISFYAENKSNLNLGIMTHALAINGYMVGGDSYGFNSFDVAPGKKTNTTQELDMETISKYNIQSFDTMDVLFWAYDNDKSFKSFDTNQIHAELNTGSQNLLDISGDTVYENNGIKIDYIEKLENTYTYCLTNTSGNYVDFTVGNLTVNDYTSSDVDYDLYDVICLNNCQVLFDVTPDEEFLSTNGITDISSMEFSLNIQPLSDYEYEWKTDMISKQF